MKTEIAQIWSEALLGGLYMQGYHAMRAASGASCILYCPLGVLVDLFHEQVGRSQGGRWEPCPVTKTIFRYKIDRSPFGTSMGSSKLPHEVAIWAGVRGPEEVLEICHLGDPIPIPMLNDSYRKSFKWFADKISEQAEYM